MRTIPAALLAHLQGEVTTLAVCWRVERSDGVLILGTEHDRDITIEGDSPTAPYGGTYRARAGITGSNVRSTSDMSVDNMEVEGAVNTGDLNLIDLSPADIEAGLFDDASVVLFLVNWRAPDDGQIVLRTGNIGAITRTAEGQYKTELRGLAQALARPILRTYGVACDADLFDARCGVSAAAWTFTGTVASVTSRREITVTFDSPSPASAGTLPGGKLTFTTGANQGFSMEVKSAADDSPDVALVLFQPFPLDIEVGDELSVTAGCDKRHATCRDVFANLVNFRGHGVFTPGQTELLKVGGQ
ncbi:MAG TPA: DUF2163 domain-containing protein [Mycolicibacterium fallax]|nr:DUF2163 domain-containing protein [Mycolicibacterium fallax]